ncbi:hypothetical protein EEDFHM_01717 [Methylorubrum populi]
MINLISSEDETYARCKALLTSADPCFLGRLGGSDTDALMSYDSNPNDDAAFAVGLDRVRTYNGFYDFDANIKGSYIEYLDNLRSCYKGLNDAFVCNDNLLTLYFSDRLDPFYICRNQKEMDKYARYLAKLYGGDQIVNFYSYDFVERLTRSLGPDRPDGELTLFTLLSEVLPGKKVLVVSPFASSIIVQQHKKHEFFKKLKYPEFQALTYQTPVTYRGLPREMYPDGSWHDTTARMCSEIEGLDFDIALLACGSYAMPIGSHIRDKCRRHAVYVGGCLQLFFGIMGRRWANLAYFTEQMNTENFIFPAEGEPFKTHAKIDAASPSEAFGAYF